MFAQNVVGTANATAGGWGNLGGGVTQVFIVWCLFKPFQSAGLSSNTAWRVSMLVPAFLFIMIAIIMKSCCQDTPTATRYDPKITGKTTKPSLWDYLDVLKDIRVVIMIFQYGACFGTELAMNAQLATHFRSYFGIVSDCLFKQIGFKGRLWAQFLALFFEAIFLFAFANVDNGKPWYVALIVLICFSVFVQMAEGTSYGIVPFMIPKQLAI